MPAAIWPMVASFRTAAAALRLPQLLDPALLALEQLRVLDRERRVAGERFRGASVSVLKGAEGGVVDVERAESAARRRRRAAT